VRDLRLVDYEQDLEKESARQVLADMTATMARRGPDDEGTYVDTHAALGHRRLAVIDVPGGHQPMTVAEGTRSDAAAPVYSGETYNLRDLRERLALAGHRFMTSRDTEVVLHAHRQWGRRDPRDADRELNGMFAYALWDTAAEKLVLVRDRQGDQAALLLPHQARRALRLRTHGGAGQPAGRTRPRH
jgi:asparagine synthase (glutamine-hydrolysing)